MAKWCGVFILSHLKIYWIFLKFFNEQISGWWIGGLECFCLSIWKAFPGAICWGLWKERNNRIFGEKYRGLDELLVFIYNTLFEWVSIALCFEELEWYAMWWEEL